MKAGILLSYLVAWPLLTLGASAADDAGTTPQSVSGLVKAEEMHSHGEPASVESPT